MSCRELADGPLRLAGRSAGDRHSGRGTSNPGPQPRGRRRSGKPSQTPVRSRRGHSATDAASDRGNGGPPEVNVHDRRKARLDRAVARAPRGGTRGSRRGTATATGRFGRIFQDFLRSFAGRNHSGRHRLTCGRTGQMKARRFHQMRTRQSRPEVPSSVVPRGSVAARLTPSST
jgi:hypothetical protein